MADYMDLIYMSFEIWIAFTCCLGNALVIWAVKLNHSLREPTFCFIVSLAVADFLVGAVAIPSAIFVNSEVETSFHGCLFICCIVMILTESSILSLLAIAVDRYLHIKMPFRSPRLPIDILFGLNTEMDSANQSKYLERWKQRMQEAYKIAKDHAKNTLDRNKRNYDSKVRYTELQPGNRVLL
nr:PREDICTED: adenosine receptor A1-like [Lepisosteus oculatus]